MALTAILVAVLMTGSETIPQPHLPTPAEQADMLARAKKRGEQIKAMLREQTYPDGGNALESREAHPAPPPEAPPGPQAPADLKPELIAPFDTAVQFFQAVVNRDGAEILGNLKAPFYFEGKEVQTIEEVRKRWVRAVNELGDTHLVLYGMELMTWDDMVKKYGKAPQRLSEVPSKGAVVAVANINGEPEVAMLHKEPSGLWQVYAFHD